MKPDLRRILRPILLRSPSLSSLLGLLLAGAAGGALGCATPAPLVRLTPRAPNLLWVSGRAVVATTDAGVRVAVAFERQDGPRLSVRVEVLNQTDAPLDVKPQDFSYVTCASADVRSCSPARPLVDPEAVLASLDETASRDRAMASNDQAALMPLLFLSVVGDVGDIASGRVRRTTGVQTALVSNQMDQDATRHGRQATSIDAQREAWSNTAFRRNTLLAGNGASGYVYIPVEIGARYVWLTVRAGGHRVPFCFEQVVTRLDPVQPPRNSAHRY